MSSGSSIRSRSRDGTGHCPSRTPAVDRKQQGLLRLRPGQARDDGPGYGQQKQGRRLSSSGRRGWAAGPLQGPPSGPVSTHCPASLGLGTPDADAHVPVPLEPPGVESRALGAFPGIGDGLRAALLSSLLERGKE